MVPQLEGFSRKTMSADFHGFQWYRFCGVLNWMNAESLKKNKLLGFVLDVCEAFTVYSCIEQNPLQKLMVINLTCKLMRPKMCVKLHQLPLEGNISQTLETCQEHHEHHDHEECSGGLGARSFWTFACEAMRGERGSPNFEGFWTESFQR